MKARNFQITSAYDVAVVDANILINAENDEIDADEGLYDEGLNEEELKASVNITGGNIAICAGEDGIESDGNINLISGDLFICSEDTCVNFDDDLYISEEFHFQEECEIQGLG